MFFFTYTLCNIIQLDIIRCYFADEKSNTHVDKQKKTEYIDRDKEGKAHEMKEIEKTDKNDDKVGGTRKIKELTKVEVTGFDKGNRKRQLVTNSEAQTKAVSCNFS